MVIPKGVTLIAIAGILLVLSACDMDEDCPGNRRPPTNSSRVTIAQGLSGDVWFWQGDFMPGCPSGHVTSVARDIFIHKLTNMNQVVSTTPAFYEEIHSELVAHVQSDRLGFFQVELSPGTYSVFVREGDRFYANDGDGQGNIQPVSVDSATVTYKRINITYASSS